MKSNLITFLNNFGGIKDIEDCFVDFRRALSGAGFKDEELSSVSQAPTHVFSKFEKVKTKISEVKKELESYGILNSEEDLKNFDSYISRKLSKIEDRTPLNGDDKLWESRAKK